MGKQDEYMLGGVTRMTVAAFGAMPKEDVERIDVTGCTSRTGMIHGGEDSRGYYFFGFLQCGEYRIFAGCRNFTPEEALAHWGPGGPSNRPDCLTLVQKIISEIKTKEQA